MVLLSFYYLLNSTIIIIIIIIIIITVSSLDICGSHLELEIENLVDLDELSEGAILFHVRKRFKKKVIVVIVIVINFFYSCFGYNYYFYS